MEYRLIGKTGLKVSCLALGTDNFADPTPELILVMYTQMEKGKK